MAAVLREVGFDPIIPEGGYFMMADTSGLGRLLYTYVVKRGEELGSR